MEEEQEALDEEQPCPEEGFHGEEKEEEDGASMEEEQKPKSSPRVSRLRDVLGHVRHFVSMSRQPRWQVLAMDVVARSAAQLKLDK